MFYTAMSKILRVGVIAVKLSDKLDVLQDMAKVCAGEPHKLYLIGLLVEHADEEEITEEFLVWVRKLICN